MSESSKDQPALRVWVLVDERPGTGAQSLGVAQILGLPFVEKQIQYNTVAGFPNSILGASTSGLRRESRGQLVAPWPDLVISAGRRTAPVARWIKRQSGGKSFLAHIMFPGRAGVGDFDLIAVPRHDRHAPRDNQLLITGAPHGITSKVLADESEHWQPAFDEFSKPLIGLVVGGATKRQKFTDQSALELGRLSAEIAQDQGGTLLVTTSRRTGLQADVLKGAITRAGVIPGVFFKWGDSSDNPYRAILALTDTLIVTGDSVSMCAEACTTTKPVYIYAPPGFVLDKHRRFHEELFDAGYARPLNGEVETWTHPRLNAAEDIAREIRVRLGLS